MRRNGWHGLITGLLLGSMLTLAFAAGAAQGDSMLLGVKNTVRQATTLTTRGGLVINNVKAANPALILKVADNSTPPLQVNSAARVPLLNADKVDGMNASAFFWRGDPLHTASCANCTGIVVNAFGAYLPGLDLTNASLTEPVFAAADLTGALLSAGMPDAHFEYAVLVGADLSGSWISNGQFRVADLTGANLTGAMLDGANFWNADLTNANLTGADLTGANLTGAVLTGTIWSNTTCPDGTNTDSNGDGDCDGVHRTGP